MVCVIFTMRKTTDSSFLQIEKCRSKDLKKEIEYTISNKIIKRQKIIKNTIKCLTNRRGTDNIKSTKDKT